MCLVYSGGCDEEYCIYPRMYCHARALMGEEAHVGVYVVLPGSQGLSKKSMPWRRGVCCWAVAVRSIQRSLCGGEEHLGGGWMHRIGWPYWMKWPSRVDFKDRRRQGSREEKIGERRMMCGWVGLIAADSREQAVVQHW